MTLTLTDDQMAIVRNAVWHELNRLTNLCVESAQVNFRLPSGRVPTQDEIRKVWAARDAARKLWNEIQEK